MLLMRGRIAYVTDRDPAADSARTWPSVSLVFTARNEALEVGAAARSMLALDYPALTLTAVDDRSTDRTGLILDEIAADDPRLRVVHLTSLPEGWLGKTHALQKAADAARDVDWLLFTDADVSFAPRSLRQAVAHATDLGLDHLTLVPENHTDSIFERLFVAYFSFGLFLTQPPTLVEKRTSRHAVGIGAFNLVRRGAFDAIGGFAGLKLSIDDDLRLAEALKCHGFRTNLAIGVGAIALRWQRGVWGYVKGLEKNAFAVAHFAIGEGLILIFGSLAAGWGSTLGLVAGSAVGRVAGALGIAIVAANLRHARRAVQAPWWAALLWPLPATLFAIAVANSMARTLARGGVVWRDSFYQLASLRQHVRNRGAWLRAAIARTKATSP